MVFVINTTMYSAPCLLAILMGIMNTIKKFTTALLLMFSVFGFAHAQMLTTSQKGDVEDSSFTCTELTYNLKLRSKDATTNNEVTALQNFLLDAGLLDADPTGYFGVATQKAVKLFQKQNGFVTSGLVGPYTRAAIKEKSCGGTTTTKQAATVCNSEQYLDANGVCKNITQTCADGSVVYGNGACSTKEKGTYIGYIDGQKFITTNDITQKDAYDNCKLDSVNNPKSSFTCTWNGVTIYSSNTTEAKKVVDTFNSELPSIEVYKVSVPNIYVTFANLPKSEVDMVSVATGKVVHNQGLTEGGKGSAIITYTSSTGNQDLPSGYYYLKVIAMSGNGGEIAKTKQFYIGGKESTSQTTPVVSVYEDNTPSKVEAVGFGVYEGVDASIAYGARPEYQGTGPAVVENGHPERVLYLAVPKTANGKVLVLTSYEPANWVLDNLKAVRPSKIIIVGYHYQRLTTVESVALPTVEIYSYQQNNVYKNAYSASGKNFEDLVTWLASKGVSLSSVNFTGTYSAKDSSMFTIPSSSTAPSTTPSFGETGGAAYVVPTSSQVLGASTMCVNLTRNFHRGDESQDTKTLQTFLISNEYLDSDVSGFYGDKTVEAVKRYQRNKGLPETGMVYEFTRESIKRDSCN